MSIDEIERKLRELELIVTQLENSIINLVGLMNLLEFNVKHFNETKDQ